LLICGDPLARAGRTGETAAKDHRVTRRLSTGLAGAFIARRRVRAVRRHS